MRGILVIAGILVMGCRYVPPTSSPSPEELPTGGSFDATWSAVIDYFAEHKIPVKTLERASGFVVAEYLWNDDTRVLGSADCGRRGNTGFAPDVATFNVRVKPAGREATIRITTDYARADRKRCESTGVWERQIVNRVVRQVAGMPR